MLRSTLYVLGLARRRLGRRSGVTALVALGIAAGAALVFGVRIATTVAQDRAVSQAIERIPDGSRALRAVWFGVPGQSGEPQPALDARVRRALAMVDVGAPTALVLYRESTLAGVFAGLGGIEGIERWVSLRSGRIPRECRPERCEVLRLRAAGRLPQPAGLRLVEVGEAALPSRVLMGDFLAPTDNALADAEVSPVLARAAGYHRPPPAPLYLAEGVRTLAAAPALAAVYRSYAWVSPLQSGRPRLWQVDDFAAGVTRARSELQAHTTSFDVVAPVEELREAQATSRRAGHRFGLVGGEAAALLFAFAILAAATRRRDARAAGRRLAWYGGRVWQVALLTGIEAIALAAAGTGLGFGVGTAVGGLVARRAGAPPAAVLGQSVLSLESLLLALAIVCVAGGVLAATTSVQAPGLGRLPVSLLDLAAVTALAVVVVAAARGAGGDLVLLLPALTTFGAAVLVARFLRPALRLLERVSRTRSTGLRLASLSLARNPGYAVLATAFLVVSFGLALFAESYRATLARGEHDQAAFAVPRDYLVREDVTRLIPVLDAAPLERFRGLADVDVEPVLRLTGGVSRLEGESGITVLGLPPAALTDLVGWRDDFAASSPRELAALIDRSDALGGARLPRGLDELVARVEGGGNVGVAAQLETQRGRFVRVDLERTGDGVLRGAIPPAARGGRFVALELEPVSRLQERGADAGRAASGVLRLTFPALPGALDGWIGVGGAKPTGTSIRYTLTNVQPTRLRPRQQSDTELVPVIATARLARAADASGLLPLQVGGERIPVRVVAQVERFPGIDGPGVVGDVDALVAALNAERPGSARVGELWIGLERPEVADRVDSALAAPPFDVLEVESRRALEADARQDPIAHGTLVTLLVAALVALVLALAGLLLTVLGDLRDERGEFFDLEAQGVGPVVLRRVVRLRALLVASAGLVAGAITGVALGALATDLVTLTARASGAEPPLRFDLEPAVVAGAVGAYALLATGLVVLATRRAFPASGVPQRVESLE
jgi:ABC-type antimicrobial peptide transport system permease subunit